MKRIALLPNLKKDPTLRVTEAIVGRLLSFGAELVLPPEYADAFPDLASENFPADPELFLVIGGDGSILDASVDAIAAGVPVLGVNLGKLGYLAELDPAHPEQLDRLFSGDYAVKEEMLLSVSILREGREIPSPRYAVNEVFASHDSAIGLATVKLFTSSGESVSYRADGLIFATPIGSTAYSLSAGGPIVAHSVPSITVTPVCPHSFFNRAIVFSPGETLTLSADEVPLGLSVDGRAFDTLYPGEKCVIRRAARTLKLLTFRENDTFSALFSKMRKLEEI